MFWILLLIVIGVTYSIGSISGAPWVPMRKTDLVRVVKILNLYNSKTKNFIELGSGDGRLLEAAAATGWQTTGYEISLLPLFLSFWRRIFSKQKFSVKVKNFWTADLQGVDAIFAFLLPSTLPRFKEKMEKELIQQTLVISYVWPIPGWKPVIIDAPARQAKIFVYERP